MNGERTAEQWAEAAARAAQRSEQKAEASRVLSEKMYATAERTDRNIGELRREVRDVAAVVGTLTTPPRKTAKSKSDFNPTDTGSHFIVPADDLDALIKTKARDEDAATYRSFKRRARQLIIAAAVGSATFGGEHLLKWLLHW